MVPQQSPSLSVRCKSFEKSLVLYNLFEKIILFFVIVLYNYVIICTILFSVDIASGPDETTMESQSVHYPENVSQTTYIDVISNITKYITFITAILGCFGSIMIIIIMTRPPFNKMPRSIICVVLAIVDFMYLTYQLILSVSGIWYNTYPSIMNRYMCKGLYSLVWMVMQLDGWCIVCLSIERVLCLYKPFYVKAIVTNRRVKITLAVIICVLLIWNVEAAYRFDLTETGPYPVCATTNLYLFSEETFVLKDRLTQNIFTFGGPVIIVTMSNLAISVKMYQIRRSKSDLQANSGNDNVKVNIMILTVTILYVLLVAPSSIYESIYGFNLTNDAVAIIFYRLSLLNPCVNAYAFFVSGSLFRTAVMKWLQEKNFCRSQRFKGHRSTEGQSQRSDEVQGQGEAGSSIGSSTISFSVTSNKMPMESVLL